MRGTFLIFTALFLVFGALAFVCFAIRDRYGLRVFLMSIVVYFLLAGIVELFVDTIFLNYGRLISKKKDHAA
jgi:hypothetical protein